MPKKSPTIPSFEGFDNAQAFAEGWSLITRTTGPAIVTTGGNEDATPDNQFGDDDEALEHVVRVAAAGSLYHRTALRLSRRLPATRRLDPDNWADADSEEVERALRSYNDCEPDDVDDAAFYVEQVPLLLLSLLLYCDYHHINFDLLLQDARAEAEATHLIE